LLLQFYIKLFGKNVTLQTHVSNWIAVTQKAVDTFMFFYLPVVYLNNFKELILLRQSQEEASSAGEQLASNKIGAYTINKRRFFLLESRFLFIGMPYC
jgi:hypothetical protein